MKKNIIILFSICTVIIVYVASISKEARFIRNNDLNVYRSILREYERVLKDETYSEDKWKDVYDFIKR